MKTKSIASVMAMMAVLGGSSFTFAQTPVSEDVTLSTEQVEVMQKMKHRNRLNNFEGLVLTDSQLQAIDSLNQQIEALAANKPVKDSSKKGEASKKSKFDTDMKVDRSKMKEARQKQGKQYLESVQQILTPDQYVSYLENIVLNQGPKSQGMKGDRQQPQIKGENSGNALARSGKMIQNSRKRVAHQTHASARGEKTVEAAK